jgi:hypothetical protein
MQLSTKVSRACAFVTVLAAGLAHPESTLGQALTMDGESGVFFQPWANVVPAAPRKWNGPTLSFHMVDAGPVAGDYINVTFEEGFGNWLDFGFTRGNHTDGGNPNFSRLFNYAGMNIFNAKVKVVDENSHHHAWIPALAIGGAMRTNVPYVSQTFAKTNATNGDIFGVGTKVVVVENKFPLLMSGGVRGTNAEVYGYGGNATKWQALAFGAIGFPLPVRGILISPTFEVDQEPHRLAYFPAASLPTSLIYAVRLSGYPDLKWSIDIGTGHIASDVAPAIELKINNAIAVAFDHRF